MLLDNICGKKTGGRKKWKEISIKGKQKRGKNIFYNPYT